MRYERWMPLAAAVAVLAGCAAGPQTVASKPTVTVGEQVFAEADAALAARQEEKAYAMLKAAGEAHPVDKRPWVKMAQIRFNAGIYGEAITHAQEALERDSDDMVAHSIVAVSGLRVASKALSDLTRKNNLNGDVKSEAQDLAKLLRASLGETELFKRGEPPRVPGSRSRPVTAGSGAASAGGTRSASRSNDPFEGLR